jgi:hypothetical protein
MTRPDLSRRWRWTATSSMLLDGEDVNTSDPGAGCAGATLPLAQDCERDRLDMFSILVEVCCKLAVLCDLSALLLQEQHDGTILPLRNQVGGPQHLHFSILRFIVQYRYRSPQTSSFSVLLSPGVGYQASWCPQVGHSSATLSFSMRHSSWK